MLRILHLSDFHYKEKNDADFRDVASKIANAINGEHFDLVIFSGDLVFDTDQADKIDKAAMCLINPIKTATGLSNDKIIIAPGNHDMKRNAELAMVRDSFAKYNSYTDIDKFAENEHQLALSLVNFKSYNDFIKQFYSEVINVKPLYQTSSFEVEGRKIGVIALNSAWRCYKSEEDRGKLVFPVFMVKEAFEKVKDCEFILCVQHHNLSDYTNSVGQEIEDIVNEKCHILFTGHYHRGSVQTTLDSEIGMLHLVAPATYNRHDNVSHYGYNILEIDTTTYEGTLFQYYLSKGMYKLDAQKPVSVPVSEEKKALNDFRKLLRKRYNQTLEKADALFVSGNDGSFQRLFKQPIIKDKSVQEILTTRKEGQVFDLKSILEKGKSSIIFGYNKRGKTSLLHWLLLEVLGNCVQTKVVPFYIDYKRYKSEKELNLKRGLHDYLELNHNSVTQKLNDYRLLLLIDDLDPTNHIFVDSLKVQMSQYKDSWFIATSLESMSNQCALLKFEGTDVDKYYIHDITSKEVHQLTMSWPDINIERKKIIEEKILQVTKQMHISLNYWTASLFLWIFAKLDDTNIHNNFELVKLYVDELLNKERFIKDSEFDVEYDDLKSYLAELAERSLDCKDYALTEKELTDFTDDYKQRNRKFTVTTWDIIRYLLDQRVIHKIEDKYSIRLKGVFEYLLAYRMKEDKTLLNNILNDKTAFISFGNELEYYAGFQKNDFKTIAEVFNKVKDIMKPLTESADYNVIDERLTDKLCISQDDIQNSGLLLERLSVSEPDEEYDMLPVQTSPLDEVTLTIKKYTEAVTLNASNVESILFILCRMYRNSNVCNDPIQEKELFDYILTGTCNLGFLLVGESKDYEEKHVDRDSRLVELVSNFMPLIIQVFLYDAIGQRNLKDVFASKLEELLQKPKGNQLRIFLLTFLLVDLDINNNMHLIEKAKDAIDNKVLRFAILNKYMLLTINNYNNIEIKNALKPQRLELAKEFNLTESLDREVENRMLLKEGKENMMRAQVASDYRIK